MEPSDSTGPPRPLLAGLNVALLAAPGSDAGQLQAVRDGLEQDGVIVVLLSPRQGSDMAEAGTALQSIAVADPDAFDGAVVSTAPSELVGDADVQQFLQRLRAEGKPVAELTADSGALDGLLARLKDDLERRRWEAGATPAENTASAVGEDG
jgi:putative intracellular protease/amidase